MSQLKEVLDVRNSMYGDFKIESGISEALKAILREHYTTKHLPCMRSAMEFICHKMARILNGNPYVEDSWLDIGGYAELIREVVAQANRDKEFLEKL